MGVELHHDTTHVRAHRRRRYHQFCGDVVVRKPLANHRENLSLALGQLGDARSVETRFATRSSVGFNQSPRNRGLNQGIAVVHHANGVGQIIGVDILQKKAARSSGKRIVDILVDVERRKDEDGNIGRIGVGN